MVLTGTMCPSGWKPEPYLAGATDSDSPAGTLAKATNARYKIVRISELLRRGGLPLAARQNWSKLNC